MAHRSGSGGSVKNSQSPIDAENGSMMMTSLPSMFGSDIKVLGGNFWFRTKWFLDCGYRLEDSVSF
jgi:hypothetical protein